MPATTTRLRRSGKYRFRSTAGPAITRPANLKELMEILNPLSQFTGPFRPMGANSASTDCNASSMGTVIDMTGMDNILNIDSYKYTVTVQAGVRIGVLANALAQHGLELVGGHDLMERTVGGAIAGGCIGPTIADDGAFFASQVIAMKVLTPGGKLSKVVNDSRKLLHAFRLSYGMLGVICEATLKVRPVRGFVATHRRCNMSQFAAAAESLSKTSIGVKFYLMPFQDRVYLDLRRYSPEARASRKIPWKLKDWGESTVLPHIFKSINRIVPISGVRYRIIDEISKATQGIVNNRLVSSGSNSTMLSHKPGRDRSKPLQYSTWLFPAADFSVVVQTYGDFCKRIRKESGFRCDMPTVGFRLSKDQSSVLSPSFDEPMFALRAVSTQTRGWEDFTIDFAEFAEHWGGYAFFNQTRSLTVDHAASAFGKRLACFRNIRRQLDPDDRMMNPFLSQYFL
jgi:FAD binding domain